MTFIHHFLGVVEGFGILDPLADGEGPPFPDGVPFTEGEGALAVRVLTTWVW